MARLNAAQRKNLPTGDFADPGSRSRSGGSGGYPIPDVAHARMALADAAKFAGPAKHAAVERKVHAKFPGVAIAGRPGESSRRSDGDADDRRHSADGAATSQSPTTVRAHNAAPAAGLDRALSDHADKLHPVGKSRARSS